MPLEQSQSTTKQTNTKQLVKQSVKTVKRTATKTRGRNATTAGAAAAPTNSQGRAKHSPPPTPKAAKKSIYVPPAWPSPSQTSKQLAQSKTVVTTQPQRTNAGPTATVSAPPALKTSKVARRASIMNLTKLVSDGRKRPEDYKKYAMEANSPSQLSFKSITEFYEPSYDFYNVEDVYTYRGYRKVAKIDEGAFGVVFKAVRNSDRRQVALKEVDLSKRRNKRIEEMKRELYVLQKIDSPYVVKLIEHFVSGSTLVIIMEFCQGSNITNHLKDTPLEEDQVRFYFRQMVTGIELMHRMGIAHRDVKLNNFLLDGSLKNVKVADFGLSVVPYKPNKALQFCKTYCGTEPYMAPEIVRRNSRGFRQYNPYYADVWALGVCLYAMLTRTFPFKVNLSQRDLYKNQRDRRWKVPKYVKDKTSDELNDLLWHMLDPEPDRRITINGIVTHPWFNTDLVVLTESRAEGAG